MRADRFRSFAVVLGMPLVLMGCEPGHPPPRSNFGAHPSLPAAHETTIPTVNFSTAEAWPKDAAPVAPAGFKVTGYAQGLDHPRWLYVLPNGDVLAAESSTVPRAPKSLKDRLQFFLERNDGVIRASANRITLLRDSDGDGVVDRRTTFLTGIVQPFGMVLVKDVLYVAGTGGVWRFPYRDGETSIREKGRKILDLPVGGYNNHWTRNIVANADGTKLYVTVGSGSNVAEHGMDNEKRRADVLEIDPGGGGERVFASGTRNPVGLAWEPSTHVLWAVVQERDMLGDDLVPDYLTRLRAGDFYGWPWSYFGKHVDARATPRRSDMVARAIAPDYALGAHSAVLGLVFYTANAFPAPYRGGAFIAMHGSWNRTAFAGYKVVYVPFANGMPNGEPRDFLTGFMPDPKNGIAHGRPVGLAVDRTGALLVADDTGDMIWRIAPKP